MEAGVSHDALDAALAEFGLLWPVGPLPGQELLVDSVLSGLALGKSGLFPDLRHWTLGATLIAGGGLRIDAGGRTVKNSAGYDLTRMAIGPGGATGVPALLQLRLERRPETGRAGGVALAGEGEAESVLSLALNNLALGQRLTFAATASEPLAANLRLAGRAGEVDRLWAELAARSPVAEIDSETPALNACARAESLIAWNAGPDTCRRIATDLAALRHSRDVAFAALPLQRRGFATGADSAAVASGVAAAGGAVLTARNGFAGFALSSLLAPAVRTLAPNRSTP